MGGWDSTLVTVSVRSYKPASQEIFVISCLNWTGEVDMKKTYRLTRGKIKEWYRTL